MKQEILSKIARLEIPLFLLKQYIPNANFLIENGDDKKIIKGFSIDSRAVQKDFVFLALEGENFDGHSFLSEVKKNHAIGAIVKKQSIEKEFSELVDKNFFLISVDNVLEAFGKIAKTIRDSWRGKLITVTGSNGKTTAKEIISNILKEEVGDESKFASYGNQNNHIGVPLNLMRLNKKNKFAVIEMGMNRLGEIKHLSFMAKPNFSLIVNAQREHQEFLGSVRATAEENGTVIEHMIENKIVIFPKDKENEDVWWNLVDKNQSKVVRFSLKNDESKFSINKNSQEVICQILDSNPLVAEFHLNGKLIGHARLNGLGEHFARTSTAAVAASIALGVSHRSILKGLETFKPIKGRGYFHHLLNGAIVVDDSYNANPDSVYAAINTLLELKGRKAMVLGDMAELGVESDLIHQEILNIATKHLDEVFLFGKYFSLASQKLKCGKPYSSGKKLHEDVKAWLNYQVSNKNSSVLWVKGSRSSNLDKLVDGLIKAEYEVVRCY